MVCPRLHLNRCLSNPQSKTLALSLHLSSQPECSARGWWPWIQVLGLEVCLHSLGHCCPLCSPLSSSDALPRPTPNTFISVDWKMPQQHRHTGLSLCSFSSGSKSVTGMNKMKFSFIKQFIQELHLQCQLPEKSQQAKAFKLYRKPPHLQTS